MSNVSQLTTTMKAIPLILVFSICLAGCSVTRNDINFDYRPERFQSLPSPETFKGTTVREIVVIDNRNDIFTRLPLIDKRVLLNKRDGHQRKTEGVFAVDRPLGEYVHQAFQKAILQAPITQTPSSPLQLRVRIDALEDPQIETGFLRTDYYLDMIVTVAVFNAASGTEVYRERIYGRAKIELSGTFDMGPYFVRTLPNTIADVVAKSLSSPTFIQALRGGEKVG